MKKMMKKWKSILMLFVLTLCFSISAYASELEETTEKDLSDYTKCKVEFTEDVSALVYTGSEMKPEIKVTYEETVLTKDTDYVVTYTDNVNAGTAKATVSGIGEYSGECTLDFEIKPADISKSKVTLSTEKYTYDGLAKKPSPTVVIGNTKLVKTTDFAVGYRNNVNIGTPKVTITGIGNYTGTKNVSYKIVLGVPKLSSKTAYNKVTLSWNKITGATAYRIQRSTSKNSGYKTVKYISNGSTVKFVDEDVKFNKTYYYRIRAYRIVDGVKKYSDYSAVKSQTVRPAQATITEISRKSYNSLKIEWKKVSGASGYGIYRGTSENGDFERVGTAKGGSTLSYTDKNLTCGRTYYYKVRAYRTVSKKNYYGANSAVESKNTKPSKVTLDDENSIYDSTEVTLRWKKASGAKGYMIYRATSKDGDYTKVKTISKNSTLNWKDTGLSKSKAYYYKIRAYCKVDGKTVYGSYSDIFTKSKAEWKYKTYDGQRVKLYYNAKGQLVKDVSNIIGKQSSYVIKVNKQKCTVTVYAKDGSNGYIIPVKSFICSPGQATPIGTFYTPQKYRWHELMGPCWGQWCTRITGGILFHSVYYNSYNNNNSLSVSAYNKLGTICSHGCVRLTAGDAKWIYDNCNLKTKVIIYNSSKEGPLGKPTASKLSSGHTWDPTDPNMKSKCKSRGCH